MRIDLSAIRTLKEAALRFDVANFYRVIGAPEIFGMIYWEKVGHVAAKARKST